MRPVLDAELRDQRLVGPVPLRALPARDLEELGAVAVDESHPIASTHAGGGEGLGHAVGAGFEFAVGDGAVPDDQCGSLGALPALPADDVGQPFERHCRGCMR